MVRYSAKAKYEWLLVVIAACLHAAITFSTALTRITDFRTGLYDLATFDQLLWNLVHSGVLLSTTNPPYNAINWLGFHFSPILYLLAPGYIAWPQPEYFLLIQSICYAVAGGMVFYTLCSIGAISLVAWIGAIAFWLNPFVISAATQDFHETCLATLFFTIILYGLYNKRLLILLVGCAFLIACKEHYGIAVAGFGVLWGVRYKDWRVASVMIIAGIGVTYCILALVMPSFNPAHEHYMMTQGSNADRYSWLFSSWDRRLQFLHYLWFNVAAGGYATGIVYVLFLLISGFMLPIAAPFYLFPATADLGANLLASIPFPRSVGGYYTATIIPVIILASYEGYKKLRPLISRNLLIALAAICMVLIAVGDIYTNLLFWKIGLPHEPVTQEDKQAVKDIETIIGREPIQVQNNIGVFFAHRAALYEFPSETLSSFAVLNIYYPPSHSKLLYNNQTNNFSYETKTIVPDYVELLEDAQWHVRYWHQPWLVMERDAAQSDDSKNRLFYNG